MSAFRHDLTQLRLDNVPLQDFRAPDNFTGINVFGYRANMPYTTYIIEFDGKVSDADEQYLALQQKASYACRDWSLRNIEPFIKLWKKATYQVAADKVES